MRLEDHLVAGLRLESDAEQEVVEHLLVRVRGVRALGLADKVEVQVRVDRRRVIDRARRRAAKVPDDAPGVRDEAGLAEGEWFWAGGEDFIENLVVRGAPVVVVAPERLVPESEAELGPQGRGGRNLALWEGADGGERARDAEEESAYVRGVGGAPVVDVADEDGDHLVHGCGVAFGDLVE